jgi:nucleotide-binding universal stress UspA family protein
MGPLIPDLWRGARLGGFRIGGRDARAHVERALRRVVPDPVAGELIARSGRAPTVLADAARRFAATLVVLGSTPGSRGRTAQYLVRRGVASVLVARSARPIRLVLVAIDGSPDSAALLATAANYARVFGARLRAVHILEPISPKPRNPESLLKQRKATIGQLLTQNGGMEGSVRRAASASAGIAAESVARRADLVIVTSWRRGLIDRLLLGSTTERLLAEPPTSLLVVRTPRR